MPSWREMADGLVGGGLDDQQVVALLVVVQIATTIVDRLSGILRRRLS